jgi:hypothetical protein
MGIKSTIFNDYFNEEMQKISVEHGVWAKMMVDTHKQNAGNYDTAEVVKIYPPDPYLSTRPL